MKKNVNEILLGIYLLLFSFLKIIQKIWPNFSTISIIISILIILSVSIITDIKNKKIHINKNVIFITICVVLVFLFSRVFNSNNLIGEYFYEFIIYGLITIFLFSKIENFKFFIKICANLSIINFLLFFRDALNNYYYFSDYMSLGLNCMLPVLGFCCLARKIFKKRIYLIFEILSIIELLLFCNKGAFLTAVVLEVCMWIINKNENPLKKIVKYCILFGIILIVYLNLNNILNYLLIFLDKINFNSYSIKTMYKMILGNNGLSGRDTIWKNALIFWDNNVIFGNGIASFHAVYRNLYS